MAHECHYQVFLVLSPVLRLGFAANGSRKTDQAGGKQRQSRRLGGGAVSDVFLRSNAGSSAQRGVEHQAVVRTIGRGRRQSQIGRVNAAATNRGEEPVVLGVGREQAP